MGAEALKHNKASFSSQQSPDGESWAAGRYTSSPMLRKSGRLAGSMTGTGGGTSFGVKVSARYAFYHQGGAHLRASIVGSMGRLGSSSRGPGRGKSGPRQKSQRQGPRRKGRLIGFLPARPIVAHTGSMPASWVSPLAHVAEFGIRRALGL